MKFEPKILLTSEEFIDNTREYFDKYNGDDYETFSSIYMGKKYMVLSVFKKAPKIPEDIYYLSLFIREEGVKFPKIPDSVKFLFLGVSKFKNMPKIPDTITDLALTLRDDEVCLLKSTEDLSYLTNLKKFSVTYRNKSLEIGKLPESLRTFSAYGVDGRIKLDEKLPKNLFFAHLHGFDNLSIPDLSYLKKLRILSLRNCDVVNYYKEPPVVDCELRFLSMKVKTSALPKSYLKDRKLVSFDFKRYLN